MNSKSEEALEKMYYGVGSEQENNENYMLIYKDLDRLKQLEKSVEHYEAIIKRWQEKYAFVEKELLQTKKNFRNSQVHSKNCYKKLKEKYTRLERAYKNNEVMTRDLNELINRNLELKDKIKELEVLNENLNKYIDNFRQNANIQNLYDNQEIYKLKQAIKILKDKLKLDVSLYINGGFSLEVKVNRNCISPNNVYLKHLEKEQAKLLKEVFESVGGKCD